MQHGSFLTSLTMPKTSSHPKDTLVRRGIANKAAFCKLIKMGEIDIIDLLPTTIKFICARHWLQHAKITFQTNYRTTAAAHQVEIEKAGVQTGEFLFLCAPPPLNFCAALFILAWTSKDKAKH
jgi:hypothetical protein